MLDHNAELQALLLNRLKDSGNFQRAYYELIVASILIRAGFTLTLEDETDPTEKHCEFAAVSETSGKRYWVEAKTREAALEAKRIEALEIVWGSAGLDEILSIADSSQLVGWCAAKIPAIAAMEDEILEQHFTSSDEDRRTFGRGFARACSRERSAAWVTAKLRGIAAGWPPRDRAELLHLLDPRRETWTLAAELGEDVERAFWRSMWPMRVPKEHIEEGAKRLLQAGRPNAALGILAVRERGEVGDPDLAIEVLEQVLRSAPALDAPPSSFGYHIACILDKLSAREDVDDRRLASIEWRLLPVGVATTNDTTSTKNDGSAASSRWRFLGLRGLSR